MDNEPLEGQIGRLADCIMTHYPDEPGRLGDSEGAVDVAIRLLTEHAEFQATVDALTAALGRRSGRPLDGPALRTLRRLADESGTPPADGPCPRCGRAAGNHHIGSHVRDMLSPGRPDGAS